jgi:hypothetical protein
MTTLDALDLAASALRECQALRSDLTEKQLLREAHDRIQHLRELEMRHGTTFVAPEGNARVVPHETNATQQAPVFAPQLTQ